MDYTRSSSFEMRSEWIIVDDGLCQISAAQQPLQAPVLWPYTAFHRSTASWIIVDALRNRTMRISGDTGDTGRRHGDCHPRCQLTLVFSCYCSVCQLSHVSEAETKWIVREYTSQLFGMRSLCGCTMRRASIHMHLKDKHQREYMSDDVQYRLVIDGDL